MKRAPKRACVLVSGGLDSCVLVADMLGQGYEVHPLYVRAGLYWEKAELHWLKRFLSALPHSGRALRALTVVDSPVAPLMGRHWSLDGKGVPPASSPWDSVYLPGRNLLLLSQAAVFCRLRRVPLIALAILKGNPFADATPAFLRKMQTAISAGLAARLRVVAPYRRMEKTEVIRRGRHLPLELTFSCLKPRGLKPCGRCGKCGEKTDALHAARRVR